MAPKGRKGAADKAKAGEEEREEPLQAVILADSYETKFNPFAIERPRCLLPLANTPLINYTFEFLAGAGVEEVWVYCGADTEKLEEYIQCVFADCPTCSYVKLTGSGRSSKYYSPPTSPFASVTVIRAPESRSIGDAMRDLDKRGDLVGDFLIVYGDLVSNMSLAPALAAHKARKEKDKNAIMTMVLRETSTPAGHQNRALNSSGVDPVFVIDPSTDRCLHYEEMSVATKARGDKVVGIEPDLLADHAELEILTDVVDTGIDICTPDVLALWSDNFDFDVPRSGFLYSVLKDYELNGKTVHTYLAGPGDGYAKRVRDLRSYDQVSRDVVARFAHPMVPEANFVPGQTFKVGKANVYLEERVLLARSCDIGQGTVLGEATSVGENTRIRNSVVGRRCLIGRGVTLDGAYVWDDAVVGDGSSVTRAIVGGEAYVGKSCVLEAGALVSFGVRIADGTSVKGSSRITKMRRDRIYVEPVKGDADPKVVGEGGDGFEFVDSEEDDEDDVERSIKSLVYNLADLNLSSDSISTFNDDEYDEDLVTPRTDASSRGSFLSVVSDDGSETAESHKAANDFHHDAATSIFDSLAKGDESTNMQLELTALRMSADASEHQVRRAVVAAFMKRIAQLVDAGAPPNAAARLALASHAVLLGRTMFDKACAEKGDQADFLLLMQADLSHRKRGDEILLWCCYELFNGDVIEQEGFEQWWEDERGRVGGEMERVRGRMGKFMERLRDSDDEGDDEDDDDDDE